MSKANREGKKEREGGEKREREREREMRRERERERREKRERDVPALAAGALCPSSSRAFPFSPAPPLADMR